MFAGNIKIFTSVKRWLQSAVGGCQNTEWLGNKVRDKFNAVKVMLGINTYLCGHILINIPSVGL